MSYNSDYKIYDGIEVMAQQVLDKRTIVKNREDLININKFPHDDNTVYMREGMVVTVRSTGDLYVLLSLEKMFNKDYSGWKFIGSGGSSMGDLDGGRADEYYAPSQLIQCGGADAFGEGGNE